LKNFTVPTAIAVSFIRFARMDLPRQASISRETGRKSGASAGIRACRDEDRCAYIGAQLGKSERNTPNS
jgi:hypothetical protein